LVCHENTDNIVKCTTNGCTYCAHNNCHTNWEKCLHCGVTIETPIEFNRITKHRLVDMMSENFMNLVNSYFYNSHDLSLLTKETMATKITIISYPDTEHIYKYKTFGIVEITSSNFRKNLLQFHNKFRVKYIFIDSKFTFQDHSDEIWNNGGSHWIGKHDAQIKW